VQQWKLALTIKNEAVGSQHLLVGGCVLCMQGNVCFALHCWFEWDLKLAYIHRVYNWNRDSKNLVLERHITSHNHCHVQEHRLCNDSGAPHHPPPMPSDKAAGKIKLNPHGHSTAIPQSMPGWLGFVRFGWEMKRRLCFVDCIFGQISANWGGCAIYSTVASTH
jgi:hypothetical protein